MKELVIKKCLKCGALVEVLEDCTCEDCGIRCCGEEMHKLIPNTVDASFEKHVPTYEKVEDEIFVQVNHVMEKDHYIMWLAMVSDDRVCKKILFPEQNAEARFKYIPGSKIYAYCNKHALWSADVK